MQLQVLELRACDNMLERIPVLLRPAYRVVSRVFSGCKDSWLLVARKPPGWTACRSLPEVELRQIMEAR
ncbi:MAG: hypothetical protein A3I61_01280 [Acidobacteria bacterium RIFCSPLOWO2_02_FULL_68_18]|nr:MAG: hypothetical protein A3I61_01280 [Acidobacteria bacterium RIFCSPLOWO2_02_FULL_68_18]